MPYIDVIEHKDATGHLKEIYDDLVAKRGKLAGVHKIQSLNPESIVGHMNLYMTIMFGRSPLKRYQREMIAVVVSAANKCSYCIQHHAEALNHYWKDEKRVQILGEDFFKLDLTPAEAAMCRYAKALTVSPSKNANGALVNEMKAAGLTDRTVLDVTLVCAYFNFVNRMVLGLGVELETDAGKGYKY